MLNVWWASPRAVILAATARGEPRRPSETREKVPFRMIRQRSWLSSSASDSANVRNPAHQDKAFTRGGACAAGVEEL